MSTFDLQGRVALVTGGFSGLGRHFATVLASHGARVAVIGRRIELGQRVATEIGAAIGRPQDVRAWQADVTQPDSIARARSRRSARNSACQASSSTMPALWRAGRACS